SGTEQETVADYESPELIPWNLAKFSGDAYPAYSWGVNVVELEEDHLTGMTKLLGVWGVFDVGTVIDNTVMLGQAEGGILQGIGYGSMEKMESVAGKIRQTSFTDYMIPTAMDTVPNQIAFIDSYYEYGPFGAKGAGELTLLGGAPAYTAAVEQVTGKSFHAIPLTPERILAAQQK
ncbi:MAG: xanthine dehydrogenase family protein molybdopterin-binding subunit, partial [Selenomonas sp.]|nr:xanthine dehydrogenase family protein molybdopterin-binding subunit [Selenomonas sp.]